MKHKIKKITARHPNYELPFVAKTDARGIDALSRVIAYQVDEQDVTYVYLASEAGLCAQTVSRLARGITKRPSYKTVVNTLNALQFEVTIGQ